MANEAIKDFINVGVVLNDTGEVLMIRRVKKESGRNNAVLEWTFPGGKQHLSENRTACVKRVVLAETGYEVEPVREISSRMHPQFLVFIVYHLCRLVASKPTAKPADSHEVAEIKWVKREEVSNLITSDLDEKVMRELELR